MATQAASITIATTKPTARGFRGAFVVAWIFCLFFYFMEYAVRSAPSVMLPELTTAFGLTTAGLSALLGLYYYSYAGFAIIAGAAVDRWGAKYTIPVGVLLLAIGTAMFGVGASGVAGVGRFLQGAGAAFAFVAAVYLASHGLPARYLATAIGVTQCVGMLGGSAGGFLAAPLIHGPLTWQKFWVDAGVVTLLIAIAMFIVTPRENKAEGTKPSIWSSFALYKTVLTNPQSYLCGLCAGLLFLPTTVGDMTWGVAFLRDGWHLGYTEAVDRAAMVPLGWVFGSPIIGYMADRIGRRKPVILAGAALMLAATAAIFYLPPQTFPAYVLAFLLGFGSGAAMVPYSVIKEVNPDEAKGSATGAMNFLVFVISAVAASALGWWIKVLADGGQLTLTVFSKVGNIYVAAILVAAILALFLKETGTAVQQKH